MDDKTKIYIGVGVVAAIGLYWWYTHKQSTAATTPATAASSKLVSATPPAGGTTPPAASPPPGFIGPPAPAAAPAPMPSISAPAMYVAPQAPAGPPVGTTTPSSVQGAYGMIYWSPGGVYDASTGIITNTGLFAVSLTLPTLNNAGAPDGGSTTLNLQPGQGFNTGTVNKNDYATIA